MASPDLKFDVNTELAARRTGMSFQRTRMSADRTLMSVIRTSLSLISFGFTIFQFFQHLRASETIVSTRNPSRNFGMALVILGIVMLGLGIAYHSAFMMELRRERSALTRDGLIHGESGFPPSFTLIIAVLLLLIGVLAFLSIAFKLGPFE